MVLFIQKIGPPEFRTLFVFVFWRVSEFSSCSSCSFSFFFDMASPNPEEIAQVLLKNLNVTIQEIIAIQEGRDSETPTIGDQKLAKLSLPLRLCYCIEQILSHHLRSGIFSRATIWDFAENLPKVLPDKSIADIISFIRGGYNTPHGRGRGFIRYAAEEGCLSAYIKALVTSDLSKEYYRPTAILRQDDKIYIFCQILLGMDSIKLKFPSDDVDEEDFWQGYFEERTKTPQPSITPTRALGSTTSLPSTPTTSTPNSTPRRDGSDSGTPRRDTKRAGSKQVKKRKTKVASIDIPEAERHLKETKKMETELEEIRLQQLELQITLQKEIQKNDIYKRTLQSKDDEISDWKRKCQNFSEELTHYQEYISKNAPGTASAKGSSSFTSLPSVPPSLDEEGEGESKEGEEPVEWKGVVYPPEVLEEEEGEGEEGEEGEEGKRQVVENEVMDEAKEMVGELVKEGEELMARLEAFSFPSFLLEDEEGEEEGEKEEEKEGEGEKEE